MPRTVSKPRAKAVRPGGRTKPTATADGPIYFERADAFGAWLAAHHGDRDELVVGFHKRGSGTPSMTWPESVEQALIYGWIDGVRRSIDANRYTIRFTPRRPRSIWSAKNIATATALVASGRMQPAGLRAFEARSANRSRVYSFERAQAATLAPADELRFQANAKAWSYFQDQPPWYRRTAFHWVISAKRAETRESRLATLIADSAAGRWIKPLRARPGKR
ncbi:MAG TPA: YdeI/OmpD-associated family protein [Kofleriaceae bacterium]|nr:YdeI/OmpD-associated family protein [Kofleriaceae bacterium]